MNWAFLILLINLSSLYLTISCQWTAVKKRWFSMIFFQSCNSPCLLYTSLLLSNYLFLLSCDYFIDDGSYCTLMYITFNLTDLICVLYDELWVFTIRWQVVSSATWNKVLTAYYPQIIYLGFYFVKTLGNWEFFPLFKKSCFHLILCCKHCLVHYSKHTFIYSNMNGFLYSSQKPDWQSFCFFGYDASFWIGVK